MYSKTTGDPMVRKPVRSHFTEVVLRNGLCHMRLHVSKKHALERFNKAIDMLKKENKVDEIVKKYIGDTNIVIK